MEDHSGDFTVLQAAAEHQAGDLSHAVPTAETPAQLLPHRPSDVVVTFQTGIITKYWETC